MNSWRPVLTGPLAERAWEAVEEIGRILTPGSPQAAVDDESYVRSRRFPSVAGGAAGQALFFAYRSRADRPEAGAAETAGDLLDSATEALASTPLAPDLYGGFSGVAWAAEHLYSPRFADADARADPASGGDPMTAASPAAANPEPEEDGEGDPLAEIDEALVSYLQRSPWTAGYDLITGLTGIGIYALERLPRPSALACLNGVVERLAETAETGPQGTTWHTGPELLPDWQRQLFPTGYYNLGVAHGVPGTIAMLGAAASATSRLAAGGDPLARKIAADASSMVGGAVRWLREQRLPAGEESWFGASFSAEVPATRSRLAWCYGDPGIAAALLVAARACGEPEWEKFAVDLAVDAATRPLESSLVRDAGLCHGSAGLAHLFNRLYQQTGEPHLLEASRTWFEKALDFRQAGLGPAGYRAYWVEPDGQTQSWRNDYGFLEGIAGIGLAMLGGLSSFEPAWDRLLALSAPAVPPPA